MLVICLLPSLPFICGVHVGGFYYRGNEDISTGFAQILVSHGLLVAQSWVQQGGDEDNQMGTAGCRCSRLREGVCISLDLALDWGLEGFILLASCSGSLLAVRLCSPVSCL